MKNVRHIIFERGRLMDDVFLPVTLSQKMPPRNNKTFLAQLLRPSLLQQSSAFAIVVVLCASSFGITYSKVNDTVSYFRDDERASGNAFHAGLLGFRIVGSGIGYTFDGPNDPDGGFHTSLVIPESGSLAMQYKISVEKTAGSDVFCNALHTEATSTPFIYSGSLLALATTTTSEGPFDFGVTLGDARQLADGDVCTVDLVYLGWSSSTPTPSGYTDLRRVPLTFTYEAPPVVENFSAPQSEAPADITPTETPTTPPADANTPAAEAPPAQDTSPSNQSPPPVETPPSI